MTKPRRASHLTREELVDKALEIVDSEGLEALTMRRLADALGVEAMSLYHHVPNKEALLDLTVDRMRSEMRMPEPMPEGWAAILETIFVEYRRVLAAHPNMLPLAVRRTGTASTSGLDYLIKQGIPQEDAVELYQSLVAFSVGYSVLSAPTLETDWAGLPPDLADRLGDLKDSTFRRTLRAIMTSYWPKGGPAS